MISELNVCHLFFYCRSELFALHQIIGDTGISINIYIFWIFTIKTEKALNIGY